MTQRKTPPSKKYAWQHLSTKTSRWEACTASGADRCVYERRRRVALSPVSMVQGVNMTQAEKLAVRGVLSLLCGQDHEAGLRAHEIAKLSEKDKFKVFKGRSVDEIMLTLTHVSQLIRDKAGSNAIFSANPANQRGSDIEDLVNRISYELKFGSGTNANIGFYDLVKDFFALELRGAFLALPNDINALRDLFVHRGAEAVQRRQWAKLKPIAHMLRQMIDQPLPPAAQLRCDAYALGINPNADVLTFQRSGGRTGRTVVGVQVNPDNTCQLRAALSLARNGSWRIIRVKHTQKVNRLTFWVEDDNGNQIKFIYHFKNKYVFPKIKDAAGNPLTAAAHLGLGTRCWNVWVAPGAVPVLSH